MKRFEWSQEKREFWEKVFCAFVAGRCAKPETEWDPQPQSESNIRSAAAYNADRAMDEWDSRFGSPI
jgi:hypothetical protein